MAKINKRKGLGRGLESILPTNLSEEVVKEITGINHIPMSQIEANPYQPRDKFDQESLEELADSIREHGIIQPLTVRKLADNQYQLIAGERRLRASKIANLTEVPVYIRTANDEQMLEMGLIENIQREDLNPIEIAISYQRMVDELGLKQNELGDKVGKKRATVANYLRLLKLPAEIEKALKDKEISMGHGRALIGVENALHQLRVFHEVVEKGLSVRQTEDLVRKLATPDKPAKPNDKKSINQIHLDKVANQLEEKFGNKVSLNQKPNGKGEISLVFNSTEDLNRILEILDL